MFGLFACLSSSDLTFWERIAEWYQGSVIRELITYFHEKYFTIEFAAYENFSVTEGLGSTLRSIILALMLGIIVSSLLTARMRVGLGGFVKKLLKEECLSAEQAKTLYELSYFRSPMIRRELERGSVLRMVVHCRERDNREAAVKAEDGVRENDTDAPQSTLKKQKRTYVPQKSEKIDFTTAHFYIPEDLRYRAEIRFDAKGSTWGSALLLTGAAVVVAALLCAFLPDVVAFVDNLISFFAP